MAEICRREPLRGEMVGAACPDCGHTTLVHPQPWANPKVEECLICRVTQVLDGYAEVGEIVDKDERRHYLAGIVPFPIKLIACSDGIVRWSK